MSIEVFECTLDILPDEPIGKDKVSGDLVFTDSLGRSTGGDLPNDPLTELTIKRLSYWVGNCIFRNEDLRLLGLYLFNRLFHNAIRRELERSYYDVFKDPEQNPNLRKWSCFRLVLKFHPRAKKELVAYPWEFLFMPKGESQEEGVFLACEHAQLVLTRFVPPSGATLQMIGPDEKLCILVAFCQPSDLSTIDGDSIDGKEIIAKIKSYVQSAGNIQVEHVANPTFYELQEAIKLHKPHIFHFVGHGKDGGIYLKMTALEIHDHKALYNEEKESKLITHNLVPNLFVPELKPIPPKPRLVFLESCEGAKSGESGGLSNAALALVDFGVPAVVAMQYTIGNGDALRFAQTFYGSIKQGVPIDEAVAAGRRVLGTNTQNLETAIGWNDRNFGTPVLYLQTKNAIIVEAKPLDLCPICKDPVDALSAAEVLCGNCNNKLGSCPKCKKLMSLRKGCGNCSYGVATQVAGTERSADAPSSAATADAGVSSEPGAPAPGTVSRSPYMR